MNEKQVLEVRKKYATGRHSYRSLAKEYYVGHSTIADIINRRSWRYLNENNCNSQRH